jgi:hypothetical protein
MNDCYQLALTYILTEYLRGPNDLLISVAR